MKNKDEKLIINLITIFYSSFDNVKSKFDELFEKNSELSESLKTIIIKTDDCDENNFELAKKLNIISPSKEYSEYLYIVGEFTDSLKEKEFEEINATILQALIDKIGIFTSENLVNFFCQTLEEDGYLQNIIAYIMDTTLKKFVSDKVIAKINLHAQTIPGHFFAKAEFEYNIHCLYGGFTLVGCSYDNFENADFNVDNFHQVFLYQIIYNYIDGYITALLRLLSFSYATYIISSGLTNDKLKNFNKVNNIFDKENTDIKIKEEKLTELFYDLIVEEFNKMSNDVTAYIYMSPDMLLNTIFLGNADFELTKSSYKIFNIYLNDYYNIDGKYTIKDFIYITYPVISEIIDDKYYIICLIIYFIKNHHIFENDDLDIVKIILNLNIFKYLHEIKEKIKQEKREKEIERILNFNIEPESIKSSLLTKLKNIENGYDFEKFISCLYQKLGYDCEVTSKSNDQGADIIAVKNDEKFVIQTKYYSNPVGNKAVQEVVSSKAYYNAKKAIVVTNSTFTSSAIQLAFKNRVELIDGSMIKEIINELEM